MNNYDWCVYTYKHRIAFEYITNKLIKDPILKEKMLQRAKVHDMDKMLMYLFMDQYKAQEIHVKQKTHHLECTLPKTYDDYVENVIDYECAPYTKPDKPLNAYDFLHKLLSMDLVDDEIANKLFEIMHDFGIDSSYDVTQDKEGMDYISRIGDVTEEMILLEVLKYVNDNRDNELNNLM